MKPLENVWSGLVQRRLLPVAILLVAALAAIPFVLAKDPEPVAPVPSSPAADNTEGGIGDQVVTLAETGGETTQRRRVLGASKNPFQPAPAPEPTATPGSAPGTAPGTSPATGGTEVPKPVDTGSAPSTPSTGGPVSVPGTPVGPAPVQPEAAPKPKHELYSLTVRFGDSASDSLERMNLPRLKALPSADEPVLVYLGPGKDAKTAIFMVDEGVVADGDAVCKPSPANCETLHMRVGDTEFLDVTDEDGNVGEQYQLDLLDIKTKKTADAAKAAKARVKASKAGRSVVRARQAAAGPLRYRYDAKSGTVRKIRKRAYKALLAKTARTALGTAGGF
jgi:hypothetical protein